MVSAFVRIAGMRRGLLFFFFLLLMLPMASPAWGRNVTVVVNGETVGLDVPPVMRHGWIFVPLRGIFEKMGASVVFNRATRTVFARKGGQTVELKVGQEKARINGRNYLMIVPAIEISGRTLVPLRFVGEALGASVNWDSTTATVEVNASDSREVPQVREIRIDNFDPDSREDQEDKEDSP
jgi:iron complex transport system substrate-binding protein